MSKAHDILGINPNASEQEIKIAYRKLAKQYHPDINKTPDSKERFIEVNNAYETLMNPAIPKNYMSHWFGIESWESIINYEDFDFEEDYRNGFLERKNENEIGYGDRLVAIYRLYDVKDFSDEFKRYYWSRRKMILLNKTYRDFIFHLNYHGEEIKAKYNREVLIETIEHLNKVLNKEIADRMPKKYVNPLGKPVFDNRFAYNPDLNYEGNKQFYDYSEEYDKEHSKYEEAKAFIKKSYKIRNQFHPKFLNKLPMRAQIFINTKIGKLLVRLEELKERNKGTEE